MDLSNYPCAPESLHLRSHMPPLDIHKRFGQIVRRSIEGSGGGDARRQKTAVINSYAIYSALALLARCHRTIIPQAEAKRYVRS
ncbi:hypothetical protein J6590_007033 [Homalodisca vitripennis]|nr:hypothetical protein J6590_007033 [Homalodisca vitripennis]